MSCSCSNCCGSGDGSSSTIVVSNCCGLPEVPDGGVDIIAEVSTSDASSGVQLALWQQGTGTAVAVPTGSQRLYVFSYSLFVGIAGDFHLFEAADGTSTPVAGWSTLMRGNLAKHGGASMRMPNRFLNLGNVMHCTHSVAGQVDVTVHGKLVTET